MDFLISLNMNHDSEAKDTDKTPDPGSNFERQADAGGEEDGSRRPAPSTNRSTTFN